MPLGMLSERLPRLVIKSRRKRYLVPLEKYECLEARIALAADCVAPAMDGDLDVARLDAAVDDDTTPPTAQFEFVSPDPRTTPVEQIHIIFSESNDPTTFSINDLQLSRGLSGVLIT